MGSAWVLILVDHFAINVLCENCSHPQLVFVGIFSAYGFLSDDDQLPFLKLRRVFLAYVLNFNLLCLLLQATAFYIWVLFDLCSTQRVFIQI